MSHRVVMKQHMFVFSGLIVAFSMLMPLLFVRVSAGNYDRMGKPLVRPHLYPMTRCHVNVRSSLGPNVVVILTPL